MCLLDACDQPVTTITVFVAIVPPQCVNTTIYTAPSSTVFLVIKSLNIEIFGLTGTLASPWTRYSFSACQLIIIKGLVNRRQGYIRWAAEVQTG